MKSPSGVEMAAQTAGLSVRLTHGPSGALVTTEPPKDNGGTGACFSPTDLVGAALAACALTTMALSARREGLPWGEASGQVLKVMAASPRRIGALPLSLELPAGFPPEQRARYEEIARTCPVALSLDPALKIELSFRWR
ncbi:MAG: OsmC family protein [Myxococcaceae bacterium]